MSSSAGVVASSGIAATLASAAPGTAAAVPVAVATTAAVGSRPDRPLEAASLLSSFFLVLEGNQEDFFFLGLLGEGSDISVSGMEG